MLISFTVGNFRSFGPDQTLNLLASKRLGSDASSLHCCEVPGTESMPFVSPRFMVRTGRASPTSSGHSVAWSGWF